MNSPTLYSFFSIVVLGFLLLRARRLLTAKKAAPAVEGGKFARLGKRMQSPEWRRYGAVLLAGKVLGIGLLVGGTYLFNPDLLGLKVFAADPVLKGNDIVNPINTAWTLIAAFL